LFIGHASRVPNVGDFFVSRMGVDSVLMTRDDRGEIHVLLNSCRHRGMKVCRYDEGNTLQFTCPFHGWSYSIDGTLVSTPGGLYGVPHFDTYGRKLEKEAWGLAHAGAVEVYKGLVFAKWEPGGQSFAEYVGEFHYWLDNLADAMDGGDNGSTVFRGVQKWRIRTNWKFVAENFLGDNYHGQPTHESVEKVGIGPGGRDGTSRQGARQDRNGPDWQETSFVELGHGACDNVNEIRPYPDNFQDPDLNEYFAHAYARRKAKLEREGKPPGGKGPATMFPNMSFHAVGFPRSILVAHPISPTETEVWRWYLVDNDAPPHVRDWLRRYYLRYSGPAGLTEQDDMENWDYAAEASSGYLARRYPYNYQQGSGMTVPGALAGTVETHKSMSEENARHFYKRWASFLAE